MTAGSPGEVARVVVGKGRASLAAVGHAALEMTATCSVWLERDPAGVAVVLEARRPAAGGLAERFEAELERALAVEALEARTGGLRAAMLAHAFGPRAEPSTPAPRRQGPVLDPETEAEIERLLAEIESDDWLADAGEIAKTWEERFGSDPGEEER